MLAAFSASVEWRPAQSVPANQRNWLITARRYRANDRLRRNAQFDMSRDGLSRDHLAVLAADSDAALAPALVNDTITNDQLRQVFACCHPSPSLDVHITPTLRKVCGLTTEAIGRAFLMSPCAVMQRTVCANATIRDARIPSPAPSPCDRRGRLEAVLQVICLVCNEGTSPLSGAAVTQATLSAQAMRLGIKSCC